MAKTKLPPKPPGGFHYHWYLREWLRTLKVSQAALERSAELSKATVSALVNDKQQYTQTHLDRIAWALKIKPHELLMPPDYAAMLRELEHAHRGVKANPPGPVPVDDPAAVHITMYRRK